MIHSFILDNNVLIKYPQNRTTPIQHGISMFERDFKKVFQSSLKETEQGDNATIVIRYAEEDEPVFHRQESYSIRFIKREKTVMHVVGSDDLGIIYGLLHISNEYFGIDPFWFWADLEVETKEQVRIPIKNYASIEPVVRYRGWFVNDEVCLIGWKPEYPPTEEVWYPVFEALLRCGGNMVIPGTDLPKHGIHFHLASEMGLWITHHHAEPLGAEMFLRAYPGEKASYKENRERFEQLWEEAIIKQKDKKVLWMLSFRGQGDQPFWDFDPSFNTPEKRGEMISYVINRQKELIEKHVENPVCGVALYGEISELYKQGVMKLPDNVIKMWADNGYGKMVSRSQGNENNRVPALPDLDDKGLHGIYYHITFHDLKASNHLTMFPSSSTFILKELQNAFHHQADKYLLLNSGNIRPHLYQLDLVSEIWKNGTTDIDSHLDSFINRLFSTCQEEIGKIYKEYATCTVSFGGYADEKAGEEFYHHPARIIIGHWLTGSIAKRAEKLGWVPENRTFDEQVSFFYQKCTEGLENWAKLKKKCWKVLAQLSDKEKTRFRDQVLFHVELHESGCLGFVRLCKAFFSFKEGNYPVAFVWASKSMAAYSMGVDTLRKSEHGKWKNFYRADWLTNIQSTVDNLDTLRKYLRVFGDSPDFFLWYKEYIMPETEKYIYLENTHREPLSDDDLAQKLEEKFLENGTI
ncbi:glycosyl hydrolase 115 family protein [Gracilibacillus dipsosauri]|uniref:glycosyl hydrolase 115 family protein n=1 Tax=Gracilibacillus dipsosauri TaxID=178340 RepID=UPI001FE592AD|nr:glycosyl hydrolase 115 family protein [Gracilibacillus dipsosauri]